MRALLTLSLFLALFAPNAIHAQATGTITGRVLDATSLRPLAGANIVVEGTQRGTLTRADGAFLLAGVPAGAQTIRASRIGYSTQERQVMVGDGQTVTAEFELAPAAVELEEIVATGYGTARRRNVTGAIASISGDAVATPAVPTAAVSGAIQGKAPGVQVTVNSGVPGAGASVRVRGSNSITANSEPLYVIDGIPAAQGTGSTDPTFNPLNSINPNDIESIQILKDASATAIYGARGANGVILVTTRRGNAGQNQVTLESSYGIQTISKMINPLGAQEFMELVNEAYANIGRDPRYTPQQIASAQSFNYVDLMTQAAPQQNHTLTFSGGDERTRYLLSGNYLNQEGVLVNSGFERFGARFNLDREMSDRFRVGTSLSMTRTEQELNRTEGWSIGAGARGVLGALNFDPSLPPRNDAGEWNMRAVLGEQLENPLANAMEIQNPRRVSRLLGNLYGEYDVMEGLRLRSTLGGNFGFERTPEFRPSTSPAGSGDRGWASVYSNQEMVLTSENTATYQREAVGPGSLELLGGFSIQTSQFEDQWSAARGFPSDEFRWDNLGAGAVRTGLTTNAVDWTLLSYIGRINYNLMDRYLFTFSSRYDGSSRFGANNKWAFFPSAAFAWRVVDEPFMRDQGLFDDLKLRVSYGVTGNQAVSEYQSLARLSTIHVGIGRNAETVTLAPSGAAPNPNLRWETQKQFNAGVDASFLDNRVTVSLDTYRSLTEDLLLSVPLPRMSGFSSQLQNIGSVENTGVEFAITTVNVQGANFGWRSTLNVSANRNEVVDLGGVMEIDPGTERYGWFIGNQSSHIVRVGEPLGSIYGYKVDGLFQQGDPCYLNNEALCAPGEYKVQDTNGDGVISASDRVILGSAQPDLYGGFSNSFSYGPLTLDAFINFSYGNEIANVGAVFTRLATGFLNESEAVRNRWTPTNTNTDIPRANNARPRLLYSTFVEDGSFVRLQTLTLGYQLPTRFVRGVDAARLFVTGQNLFTLTDYSGFDPEVNSLGGDARFGGVDTGAFPRARTWNVGVNVTF